MAQPERRYVSPDPATLQRTGIETNEHEDIISKDAVNPASIDVTFDDIGGARIPHHHHHSTRRHLPSE